MTNKEIFNLYEGLEEIFQDKTFIFDIKTSFKLAKNKNILEPFYNSILEARNVILYKYGTQDKDDTVIIKKEEMINFEKELTELMELENNIQLEEISLNELEGKISVSTVWKLIPIIK